VGSVGVNERCSSGFTLIEARDATEAVASVSERWRTCGGCQLRTDRFWCSAPTARRRPHVSTARSSAPWRAEYVRRRANDSPQDLAAAVYGAARSFGASDDQHDHITSVIIKVTDAARGVEQTPLTRETMAV
jgi:hypothetical protein